MGTELILAVCVQVYIRSGYGRLSETRARHVIEGMRPLLREQRYAEALRRVS